MGINGIGTSNVKYMSCETNIKSQNLQKERFLYACKMNIFLQFRNVTIYIVLRNRTCPFNGNLDITNLHEQM